MSWKTKLLIGIFGAALIVYGAFWFVLQNPFPGPRQFHSFTVDSGESFGTVATRLKTEGLLRSKKLFYYLGRLSGKSGSLKAGEYELNTEMTAWEILKVVTGSHVKLYRVTIPEGITMFQVAQILENLGLVDQIQFLENCWDPSLLEELQIPSFTVEGYLYPETYYIPRGSSPRAIIKMFVEMFWSRIPESEIAAAKSGQLSIHQALIMASMIQKETGLVAEMGLISSVFYNRLKKGMRLQSDPTAIYDTHPYGGKVTREDLFRKSPFNTYAVQGLPLTPISNPGYPAIYAALHPQATDYLYFVSRRDGSHQFSSNFDEHRQNIHKFLQ